ncbi:unnamed protein product [Leptidea sinapis]|uniref:Uncharacterized protein n=1 Tax=Leptidea sinapis TaxID=189913 RepID=A0A5E4QFZ8_9NEOP|nr:unnamed protein product [Leptidea sinapis]
MDSIVRNTEDQEKRDEEVETNEPEPPPSIKEALKAAKLLEIYFLYHQEASILQDINKISSITSQRTDVIFIRVLLKSEERDRLFLTPWIQFILFINVKNPKPNKYKSKTMSPIMENGITS